MRINLIALVIFCFYAGASAQNNLSGSPKHSRFVYIYKIDEAEALRVYKGIPDSLIVKYLHSLIDSVPDGVTECPRLAPGNYLWVRAERNSLRADLRTSGELRYDLFNDGVGFGIVLRSASGQTISDATVHLGRRSVPYDYLQHCYRLPRRRKGGVVRVSYQGTLSWFPIEGKERTHRSWFRTQRDRYAYRGYGFTKYQSRFRASLIFSKPKYKPGDTIQCKAFILDKKGHPVSSPLAVRLKCRYAIDTVLSVVTPYRPGAYIFSIPLTDSLDLDLDEYYEVSLEKPARHPRNHADDDEDDSRRKIVVRNTFQYEEYELSSLRLQARIDKKIHGPGEHVTLILRAVDENEMTAPDARVSVRVTVNDPRQFFRPHVFVPDLLWQWSQPLDPVGETQIVLPDSIFPAASFDYTISCEALNSNNQHDGKSFRQEYKGDSIRIDVKQKKDSLFIDRRIFGKSTATAATLYMLDRESDTLERTPIHLPTAIFIDPRAAAYSVFVRAGSITKTWKSEEEWNLRCLTDRRWDSLHIRVSSPTRLQFRWTLFCGNKILQRGYTDSLAWDARTHSNKNYALSLQYVWGGKIISKEITIPFGDKLLNIAIHAPENLGPGTETTIRIDVTDPKDRPVPNADLTVYGVTSKFTDMPEPSLPYAGKRYAYRKKPAAFSGLASPEITKLTRLDWQKWRVEMGLDTSEYYRFLHPDSFYINREPAPDGITQIAPFVFHKGETRPAEMVYIDELPVFFGQTNMLNRYSFPVSPGKHALRLRIAGREVWLDSIFTERGMKTFVNIDPDKPGRYVREAKRPDTLTLAEKQFWSRVLIRLSSYDDDRITTITQNKNVFIPDQHSFYGRYNERSALIGPFLRQPAFLRRSGDFNQEFYPEGEFIYTIEKGLIKQKQYSGYPFLSRSLATNTPVSLSDRALTLREADSLWEDLQDKRSAGGNDFVSSRYSDLPAGRLTVDLSERAGSARLQILKVFIFRSDDTDFLRIFKGNNRHFGSLPPGLYRLVFLLKGDRYRMMDSLSVKPDGLNYYSPESLPLHPRDSFSIRLSGILRDMEQSKASYLGDARLSEVSRVFNDKWLDAGSFEHQVSGTVNDKDGKPVVGVSVMIKGTRNGTVTDANGNFRLDVPANGTLQLMAVGYTSQEHPIRPDKVYTIRLVYASKALDEVVVTAYRLTTKRLCTGYVESALQGGVPGLAIRGLHSTATSSGPLIIIDGVPFNGMFDKLDPASVASMTVLKDEEAIAIYGSRGASGAIIITTRQARQLQSDETGAPAFSIRRDFRDNAFWQPRLRTDDNGSITFDVRFPDDITRWRIFALAMASHGMTGYAETSVKAFKTLTAQLSLPRFAVEGDSLELIGKIAHYLPDSISVDRSWRLDSLPVMQKQVSVRTAHIDRLFVKAAPWTGKMDSLRVEYSLRQGNAYSDGERRTLPIFPAGVKETAGTFAALDQQDTSFTLSFPATKGPVSFYAESSLLPVLEEEIGRVRHYEYFCNEQLASKLKVLLQRQRIDSIKGAVFSGEKEIRSIVSLLNKARRKDGLWGWFPDGEPYLWISLHAVEALLQAEKAGYGVFTNKQPLIDFLVYSLESQAPPDGLTTIRLLLVLGAKADYPRLLDSAEARIRRIRRPMTLYEQVQLLTLRQTAGIPIDLSPILSKRRSTVFGNTFWGDESRELFDNDVLNSVYIYRLLRQAGGYDDILKKTRNYFLEKRRGGQWKNTYESCLLLETLLPDVLKTDPVRNPATIIINDTPPITSFPFKLTLPAGTSIKVRKRGALPVYFNAYQECWQPAPAPVSGDFEVHASFLQDGKPVTNLQAGVPVILEAKVRVKADAAFLMVEIPIPGGCSYAGKDQSWASHEVHREHFLNKVSIFCTELEAGDHTFRVQLMPRFSGSYRLNPAKVEMMYFPVFFGREGLKEVLIRSSADTKAPTP